MRFPLPSATAQYSVVRLAYIIPLSLSLSLSAFSLIGLKLSSMNQATNSIRYTLSQ